jgi:hypothetical protein
MRIADGVSEAGGVVMWKAALLAVLMLCALLPLLRPAAVRANADKAGNALAFTEAPRLWQGRALRPLALSAVEQRFAAQFPGRIARFTDGEQLLVLRDVRVPTRMLHPAADCYRGLGYRIEQARLERDANALLWRCFIAQRGGARTRVCERIADANGASFTDASSWYWAAQLGQSSGPWRAITTARPL